MGIRLVIVMIIFLVPGLSYGESYLVRPDGSGDFPDLRTALFACNGGDEVLLADGVYMGDGFSGIDGPRIGCTVRSESNDPSRCRIECGGRFFLRYQNNPGVRDSMVVQGLAISGASGIVVSVESFIVILRNMLFEDNFCANLIDANSGNYLYEWGSIWLEWCEIRNNQCDWILVSSADLRVSNTTIEHNTGTVVFASHGVAQLSDSLVLSNSGPGALFRLYSGGEYHADFNLIARRFLGIHTQNYLPIAMRLRWARNANSILADNKFDTYGAQLRS